MASIKYYPNGAGGTYGADLATLKPTYQSGVTWYVGNANPAASNANAGNDRDLPLATLQQAVTNSAAGDVIDILASHSETISAKVSIAKIGLSIVGEGIGSTIPRLTNGVAGASGPMIEVTVAGVLFDNLYFPGSTNAGARERIGVTGGSATGTWMRNLTFECSANDTQRSLFLTSPGENTVLDCTFTSTGALAGPAVELSTETGDTFDNVVFDAGSFSWSAAQGAFYQHGGATLGLRMTRISLLNGSNVNISTGSTGILQVSEQTGDSVVIWVP